MWQRSVAVLLAVMMVAVRDGTMGGATVPQGPRSEWQSIRQVDSADTSVASVADRPWAIVLGVRVNDGGNSSQRSKIRVPLHSSIVRNLKILIDLCIEEGVFSMFHDCTYFYYCFENVGSYGRRFEQHLGVCDEGYSFDDTIKDCVLKSCYPHVQNNPTSGPPGMPQHDDIMPPAPTPHQIPTWLNEEPEWYNKQPAILKKAPSWYYTPPHWYNSPPTPMPPGTAVTHKTQASQVDQIIKRQE